MIDRDGLLREERRMPERVARHEDPEADQLSASSQRSTLPNQVAAPAMRRQARGRIPPVTGVASLLLSATTYRVFSRGR